MDSTPQAGTTITDIPEIALSIDATFRRLTARAHAAERAGDSKAAHDLYAGAAEEAERLLARARQGGAAAILLGPMALTVAAHNRAVLHGREGAMHTARAISLAAAERLIADADSASTPLALRLNCVRHLRHALGFLADLEHDAGEAARLGERTRAVAAEVIRVANLMSAAGPIPPAGVAPPRGGPFDVAARSACATMQ